MIPNRNSFGRLKWREWWQRHKTLITYVTIILIIEAIIVSIFFDTGIF